MSIDLVRIDTSLHDGLVVSAQKCADRAMMLQPETMGEGDLKDVTDLGVVISKAITFLEDDQRNLLSPLRDYIQRIQSRYAPVIRSLKDAKDRCAQVDRQVKALLRTKREREAAEARAAQERAAQEAARIANEQAEAAALVDAPAPEVAPEPPPLVIEPERTETKTKGHIGDSYERANIIVEMVDVKAAAEACPSMLRLDTAVAKRWLKIEMDLAKMQGKSLPAEHGGLRWRYDITTVFRSNNG